MMKSIKKFLFDIKTAIQSIEEYVEPVARISHQEIWLWATQNRDKFRSVEQSVLLDWFENEG